MADLSDPVVGHLSFNRFFWEREDAVRLFAEDFSVRLRFEGEEDMPLEDAQRSAYAAFAARTKEILAEAEAAVYDYYQEIAPEYREMFGDDAGRIVPVVTTAAELASIITPTHLLIPRSVREDQRVVGLVCDCTWEPGLGLGVKFINEQAVEIGTQDIVL